MDNSYSIVTILTWARNLLRLSDQTPFVTTTLTKIKKPYNLCGCRDSSLEATPRFELGNRGFADLCLTTWLCRLIAFPKR